MRNLEEIRAVIEANRERGADNLDEGLSSAEIGEESRAQMFGDDGAGFPDEHEWSCWVD